LVIHDSRVFLLMLVAIKDTNIGGKGKVLVLGASFWILGTGSKNVVRKGGWSKMW